MLINYCEQGATETNIWLTEEVVGMFLLFPAYMLVFSIALHPLAVHLFVSPDFNATYDDIVGYKKEVVGSLLLTATDAYLYYIFSPHSGP
jgi:hypothetical protein